MKTANRPDCSRRDFLKSSGLALAGITVQSASAAGQGPADSDTPKIETSVRPGSVTTLSTSKGDSDYPSVCCGLDGSTWAVWQNYFNGNDRMFIAHSNNGEWEGPLQVPEVKGDLYKPACGVDRTGQLWLVWSQQINSQWGLWTTSRKYGIWSRPRRISVGKGANFAPRIAPTPDGSLVMVWQTWRGENFDILLSHLGSTGWGRPEVVTESDGNDWLPSVAVSPDGTINVTWDSYRNGSYDVFLRRKKNNNWGEEIIIAGSSKFEAYSSVAADSEGRVWIAYEQRSTEWGKDWGCVITPGFDETKTLLGFCRIRVLCYKDGRLLQPIQPLEQLPVRSEWGGDHSPSIILGSDDRVWLVYHRPKPNWMKFRQFKRHIPLKVTWSNYATHFDGDKWSEPISLEDTPSRQDSNICAAALPNGRLLTLWHSNNRVPQKGPFVLPQENSIYASILPKPACSIRSPRLTSADPGVSIYSRVAAEKEKSHVLKAKNYKIKVNGKKYRLFRGDLHRHTDISWDGCSDSSLMDLFRYALDAAGLDFVSATDHYLKGGVSIEYSWRRTQKITDLFNAPPHFISLFGHEAGFSNGHRNIIGARRFPAYPGKNGDIKHLYKHVRKHDCIAISHCTGAGPGTEWPECPSGVEPIVEIYQGCRNSYEYEGAPRADLPDSQPSLHSGYSSEGFLWKVWKKGLRFGVIASSDHQSTHVSYANVYAEKPAREELIKAMRHRQTYGSTDNIVLDFRADGHLQGSEFKSKSAPTFYVRVIGTAPIRELVIIKDCKFICRKETDESEIEFEWKDAAAGKGTSFYYVRIIQSDGQIAWSSPVWVTFT